MSIFSGLFASKSAIDNLTNKDDGLLAKAGSWVGGLNYTDEERAESNHKVRDWGLRALEALAPFKVVQRILAFFVAAVWAFVVVNVVGAIWYDALNRCLPDDAECVPSDVASPMLQLLFSDAVFWPVLAVLSLYFTGGVLPGLFKSEKGQ